MDSHSSISCRSFLGCLALLAVAASGAVACSSSSDVGAPGSDADGGSEIVDNDAESSALDGAVSRDAAADGGSHPDGGAPHDAGAPHDGGVTTPFDAGPADAFSICNGYTEIAATDYTVSTTLVGGTATPITGGTQYAIAVSTAGRSEAMGVYKVAGATDICVTADMSWASTGPITKELAFVDSDGKYATGDSQYSLCAIDGDAGARLYGQCSFEDPTTPLDAAGQPLHLAARLQLDPFKKGSGDVQGQVEVSNASGTAIMDGNLGAAGGLGGSPTSMELHLGVRYGLFGGAYPATAVNITNVHVFKR